MSGDALVGTVLADRYRLDALLGEGGMGKVYEAEHVLMRKRLAVKVLHRQLTQVPEVVARFEREAMAAAHIDHPNVAGATDFGKLADGSVYLVLEYVEGRLLRDEMAAGPMSVERALPIVRQIASALAAAHALEIVHRDLKPENVMLVERRGTPDFVKVLDFGIAKVPIGDTEEGQEGRPITKAGMVYGTPEYMAPEQALGQSVDGRADIYALGVILFELLAGKRPFGGKSQVGILGQQLSQPVPTLSERAPAVVVTPAVENLVHRLLAREADERVQTAAEVVSALDGLLATAPQSRGRLFTLAGGSPSAVTGVEGGLEVLADAAAHSSSAILSRGAGEPEPIGVAGALAVSSLPETSEIPKTLRTNPGRKRPTEKLITSLTEAAAQAAEYLETRKSTLPIPLQKLTRDVSGRVLLGGIAFGVLGILTAVVAIVIAVTREPAPVADSDGPNATEEAPDALDLRIADAEKAGLAAMEKLAEEKPSEGRVLVALASVRADSKKYRDAVRAVSDALAVDPGLNEDERVAKVLFRTAQSQSAGSATFRLLTGPMGTRGADIIYDLAITRKVKQSVKARAENFLASKEFERAASPALNIAVALRHAKTCAARKNLLERAKNVGDQRSLRYLHRLTPQTGCGKNDKADCNPCLRGDDSLAQAIQTIGKRVASKSPAE